MKFLRLQLRLSIDIFSRLQLRLRLGVKNMFNRLQLRLNNRLT